MIDRDPNVAESNAQPVKLRKLFARTFLGVGRPAEARPHLQSILARGPDPEASWLLSRVYLQQGAIAEAREALAHAGSYRGDNPLEDEPSPHVGEARCQKCHAAIFQDSLANRHTQTYYRGAQLRGLPRPDRPLADPTDPKVTHAIKEVDGTLWEETRVGDTVFRSIIEYAFGTSERYLTMVSRDARDQYRMARLSHYHTADGQGWDRTLLAVGDPTQPEDFQGETIGVRLRLPVACIATSPTPGGARTDRPRDGRPRHRLRALSRPRGQPPRGGRGRLFRPSDRQPSVRLAPGCHAAALQRLPHPRPALPVRRPRKTRLGPLARGRLELEPVQHRERRRFRLRHLPRPPPGPPVDHDRKVRGQMPRLPLGQSGSARRAPAPVAQASTKPKPRVCSVDPARGCIKCHMPGVRMDSSHRDLTDHYIRIPRLSAAQRGGATSKAMP